MASVTTCGEKENIDSLRGTPSSWTIALKRSSLGQFLQKACLTNSIHPVQIAIVSEACKYAEISSNVDLKEHYIHTPDGNLSQLILNTVVNKNTFL